MVRQPYGLAFRSTAAGLLDVTSSGGWRIPGFTWCVRWLGPLAVLCRAMLVGTWPRLLSSEPLPAPSSL